MPSNVATDTVDSIFNRMDTQSYIYMDNMAKSMRRAGVVWLSMAREVYGSDTPMRIVNEDGSDDVALMTGEVVDRQTGQVIALNDLSQGNYEVTVDVGQSFANANKPSSLQTAISGGTSGAITGAGLASLLGTSTPWGAGIGAGIGLLGSLF
ncbi:hypothetical protein NQ074_00725 [Escherichia coli]|uniref:portal protein n=1 Tax=Escherichia coli TaxID=562 RepID=UPI0023F77F4E|nr:portal protein [Escherichia coli]MDF7545117.1 hypothetical protein [Escherichia coli]